MADSASAVPEPGELLALALEIAREAAELVALRRSEGVSVAATKSSVTDIVTAADQESEALIRARIQAARPADGMLGEEGSDDPGTSGVRWVVDPIDGTVNYAHGLAQYAVSIGVEVDGEVVAGVVLSPGAEPGERREYAAVRGGGATCNGRPLRVADRVPMERALIGTGFSYSRELRIRQAASVARMLPQIADIRRYGACSLDLCAVASGSIDGYVEEGIGGAWDHAAGGLIAVEAGAVVEAATGAAGRLLVIAAPAGSFEEFRELAVDCGFLPPGS